MSQNMALIKFEKFKEPFQLMTDGCAIKCAHPTLPVLAGVSINQVFLFDETDGTRHISTFSTWGKYDDDDEDEDEDDDYYFNNNDEDDDEEDQPTHRERSNEITAEITQLGWNANGDKLTAGFSNGDIIVWEYPSGEILFKRKCHWKSVTEIHWNPHRRDNLATLDLVKSKNSNIKEFYSL
uniref:Anaphase-promoting complex subunit 4-like WD40 domain-containing protein n=1 Tax=Daphnia galeata TaxID=27404 RepID=A0A8J2WNI8_9CRUS|nr:unnamed protein product [Daphnia galeata]